MKVTFYSNFLTHHQTSFCKEMQKRLGDDFKFVSTMKIFQWRLDLGWKDLDQEYDFVVRAYENQESYDKAKELALTSDIVIIGSTTDELIEERLKQDKIIFRYRSRVFSENFIKTLFNKEKMKLLYQRHLKYRKNKNMYLLCANAYGARDFNSLGLYKNKTYKWGYFLELNQYNIEKLIEQKEQNEKIQIVWVARFIDWKHPEIVLKLASDLKESKYDFQIKMLGTGELEDIIKNRVKEQNLEDVIELVGQVPSDKVKDYYENANIFIGTSGREEGWGAVVNEAMNAGCAVIANQNMGSVPFLIKDNYSGMIYNTYDEFLEKTKKVIEDKNLRIKLCKNAYKVITEEWDAKNATENLLDLFESIINENEYGVKDGPGSKAT